MTVRAQKGRPPKVRSDDIARAAIKIGLAQADMRGVAKALGVTLQALYYHIESRNELISLASRYMYDEMFKDLGSASDFFDAITKYAASYYELCTDNPQLVANVCLGSHHGQAHVSSNLYPWIVKLMDRGAEDDLTTTQCIKIFSVVTASVLGAAAVEAHSRAQKGVRASFQELAEAHKSTAELMKDGDPLAWDSDAFDVVRITIAGLRDRFIKRP